MAKEKNACGKEPGCCDGPSRRDFLQVIGLGTMASLAGADAAKAMAGPFDETDFARLVPPDKKLDPGWVKSLYDRGQSTTYTGSDLALIGMPVGGICAGQLYLGGDGKLWHWDIFNRVDNTNDAHYAHPMRPQSPLDQGFALRIKSGTTNEIRTLDHAGFSSVRFRGEYPIGFVSYSDSAVPVAVELEAFSPFIPLNTDDSSLPATILVYRIKNVAREPIEVELGGWLENAICLHTGQPTDGYRRNRIRRDPGLLLLECSAEPAPERPARVPRPTIILADFDGETYGRWTVEGEAFGARPSSGGPGPSSV